MLTAEIKPETKLAPPRPSLTHLDRIVLTGFMGAGKSTVGRALAAHLGWEFFDLDAVLEEKTGKRIVDLFAELGEPSFRKLETQALASVLGKKRAVIALGGGVPEQLTNRLLLEQKPNTAVVFLDAPFAVLFDRCVLQPDAAIRPVLQDPEKAAKRFQDRQPHYRRLARIILPTEALTPEQTIVRLIEELRAR